MARSSRHAHGTANYVYGILTTMLMRHMDSFTASLMQGSWYHSARAHIRNSAGDTPVIQFLVDNTLTHALSIPSRGIAMLSMDRCSIVRRSSRCTV
jgi:hypothetical protein